MKKIINTKIGTFLLAFLLITMIALPIAFTDTNYMSSEDILEIQKEEMLALVSEEDILKRELLESMLEFADENTPIDSLSIPGWIFE